MFTREVKYQPRVITSEETDRMERSRGSRSDFSLIART